MRWLRKKISPVTANFSASNQLILVFMNYSDVSRVRKKILWLLIATPIIFMVWQVSWIFDFFNDFFFSKDLAWSSVSINLIDSFHSLSVTLKKRSNVKQIVRKYKNDTKAGKTGVWKELRPKLIHQYLALNNGLLKKWC